MTIHVVMFIPHHAILQIGLPNLQIFNLTVQK